jgi:hypothetical protein
MNQNSPDVSNWRMHIAKQEKRGNMPNYICLKLSSAIPSRPGGTRQTISISNNEILGVPARRRALGSCLTLLVRFCSFPFVISSPGNVAVLPAVPSSQTADSTLFHTTLLALSTPSLLLLNTSLSFHGAQYPSCSSHPVLRY